MSQSNRSVEFVSILFFILFTIFLAGYAVHLRMENSLQSSRHFDELMGNVSEFSHFQDSEALFSLLENNQQRLVALLIQENGEPLVFWGNENLAGVQNNALVLRHNEIFQETLSKTTVQGFVITGIYQVLGNPEVFQISRNGVIILFAFSFIVIFWYFIASKKESPRNPKFPATVPTNQLHEPLVEDSTRTSGNGTNTEKINQNPNPVPETREESANSLVCDASQMEERLAGELHRAGSNQADLTLAIIQGDKRSKNNDFFNLLREHFMYRDILFQDSQNSCWVILPQMDLDSGIKEVEKLLSLARRRFALGESFKNIGSSPEIFGGISSRNGRILGADRLKKEARAALKKTDGESPVVGFRSNPEKYREFILHK